MLLLLLISSLVLVFVHYKVNENFQFWKLKGVKYVKPVPFFGNMLGAVTQSTPEFIQNLYNKFPKERFFGLFQFNTPILMIKDPELLKKITIQNFDHFVDHHTFDFNENDPLTSKSLFFSTGNTWRTMRQNVSPVFTSSKMRMMFTLMDESVRNLLNYYRNEKEEIIPIEMKDVSARFTSDSIASVAFGIKCDSFTNRNNPFLLAGLQIANFSGLAKIKFLISVNFPKFAKWINLTIISKEITNFLNGIINDNISEREKNNIIRPDIINLLMMARKEKLDEENSETKNLISLSNEDIAAQAMIFLIGGLDSTSTSISFTSYELALNPEIQTRLRKEILKVEEPITYEKLSGMKYFDMVISESLRKWPSFAWSDRRCTKAFEIQPEKGETGLKVEVGDVIWFPILPIQMDPKFFPEPEKFIPERFREENKSQIEPFTYIPFGNGPRNCIGARFALLETKIFFYYLLRDFEIVPTAKTEIPIILDKSYFSMMAKNGYHLGLKHISK